MDEIYDSDATAEPTQLAAIDFVSIASELAISASFNDTSNRSLEAAIVGSVRHLNPAVQVRPNIRVFFFCFHLLRYVYYAILFLHLLISNDCLTSH